MSNSHANAQSTQHIPKILYVEDQLAQNIPRLLRLFGEYLGKLDRNRLEKLEQASEGYGADPEEIKQVFKDIQKIDIEYRFPDALSKIRQNADQYALFIIDRNLSETGYTMEEVQNIEAQYTQKLHERFHEREGDYLLLKLAMNKQVDVLNKFYFLTAYSAQHEIRSSAELENFIDLGAFQQKNFIEKGNEADLKRLLEVIRNIQKHVASTTELYIFDLKDGSTIKGAFVSPVIKIQTGNGKMPIDTRQIVDVTSIGKVPQSEYIFALKSGDSIQGRFLDKKIIVNTQINPKLALITQNIHSIKIV